MNNKYNPPEVYSYYNLPEKFSRLHCSVQLDTLAGWMMDVGGLTINDVEQFLMEEAQRIKDEVNEGLWDDPNKL